VFRVDVVAVGPLSFAPFHVHTFCSLLVCVCRWGLQIAGRPPGQKKPKNLLMLALNYGTKEAEEELKV
jgi:hypothetical protein